MKVLALFLFFLTVALSAVCAVFALYIWNEKFREFVRKFASFMPDIDDGKEDGK